MSTSFVRTALVYIGCLVLVYVLHYNSIDASTNEIAFSLVQVYFFHGIASLILCVALIRARASDKYTDQVGFIYLISVLVKAVLFFVIFRKTMFSSYSFSNQEAVSVLIPLFLGLFFEVFFLSKLLKKTPKIKNE